MCLAKGSPRSLLERTAVFQQAKHPQTSNLILHTVAQPGQEQGSCKEAGGSCEGSSRGAWQSHRRSVGSSGGA